VLFAVLLSVPICSHARLHRMSDAEKAIYYDDAEWMRKQRPSLLIPGGSRSLSVLRYRLCGRCA